jgi:hypothetical protein
MVLTKRTCNLPLICQICGDIARGINFDVMTCMSCKAFFRRHALQPSVNLLIKHFLYIVVCFRIRIISNVNLRMIVK